MSRSSPDRRRARRARLTVDDIDQQQSLRGLAALSEKEWAEYLLVRYPMSVAFDWIGIPRPAEQRLSAEAEARIRRALGNDRGAVVRDLLDIAESTGRAFNKGRARVGAQSLGPDGEWAGLSEEEWARYLRRH